MTKLVPVRLLVLCERVASGGGAETYLQTTLPALVSAGISVLTAARLVEDPGAYGTPVEHVPWSDEHEDGSRDAAARIGRIAAKFSPDVIALHGVLDAAVIHAARQLAPANIYHLHDHRLFCPNGDRVFPQGGKRCTARMGSACIAHSLIHGCAYGPRMRTIGLIRRRERTRDAAAQSDTVAVFSQFMRASAVDNGIPASRAVIIDPPLHSGAFAPAIAPRRLTDSILFSGRIYESKGIFSLIRALATIAARSRPLLKIAGTGPDLQGAIALALSLHCEVRALGPLSRAGVAEALDEATLVAMPSLWDEPFGFSGLEAFARGRPVVAYASGAIPEWIGAGGIAVPAGDESALAGAIETLLGDRAWRSASQAAQNIASRYTIARHLGGLMELYRPRPDLLAPVGR